MDKILTVKTLSGTILLVIPDGKGGVLYRQLNGELYTGICEGLTTYCCDGKSAYNVAVDYGFVGTEEEWLESLVGADGTNGINGTNGTNGAPGAPGADGASAYEIAVANGFVGTEAAWLLSLKGTNGTNGTNGAPGEDGIPGADGASAYEIAVANGFVGTEAAWLLSLVGPAGAPGADDWGDQKAETDVTLLGDGTVLNPLSVASPFNSRLFTLTIAGTNVVLKYDGNVVDSVDICDIDCQSGIYVIVEDGKLGNVNTGHSRSFDLSGSVIYDPGCAPITYAVSNEINCAVHFNSITDVEVTPTVSGTFSFVLRATCTGGTPTDTGTFRGMVVSYGI